MITVAPPGHSPNEVLNIIEHDLITGAKQGFRSIDPFGRAVRIFIDTVAMFGDYPALSGTADVRGHNATSFCTFCTFRERPNSLLGSKLYTSCVHSKRLSAMRNDERRTRIRPHLIDERIAQRLGMKKCSHEASDGLPMVKLAKSLNDLDKKMKNVNGDYIVPIGFDSFQSMAVAPDHLLSNLIDNVLTACFQSLDSNEKRKEFELWIITDTSSNGLPHQGKFLKWKDSTFEGIKSLSMSTRFSLLLFAVFPFKLEYLRSKRIVFDLPRRLQCFIALVYHVPDTKIEGSGTMDTSSGVENMRRKGEQHRAAQTFLKGASMVFEEDQDLGSELNKPNAHRFIELCVQTITQFGHARNCSEMILEMAHRKFKGWLECNSHASSHLSGMERALASEWQGRLCSTMNLL